MDLIIYAPYIVFRGIKYKILAILFQSACIFFYLFVTISQTKYNTKTGG